MDIGGVEPLRVVSQGDLEEIQRIATEQIGKAYDKGHQAAQEVAEAASEGARALTSEIARLQAEVLRAIHTIDTLTEERNEARKEADHWREIATNERSK